METLYKETHYEKLVTDWEMFAAGKNEVSSKYLPE